MGIIDDSAQAFCASSVRLNTMTCPALPFHVKSLDGHRTAALQWRMLTENPADRLTEIATILGAGLLRLQSRKSSPNLPAQSDSPLDCEGNSGGDVTAEVEVSRP
jgi:hypothetical protein